MLHFLMSDKNKTYLETGTDLYVLQSAHTGAIKIGRTNNINRRIEELQTGCPYKLKLLVHLPGKGDIEHYLHDRLSDFRIRSNGEWFKEGGLPSLPEEIYDMIDLERCDWWKDFS